MLTNPTPSNPLVLYYADKTPSMKNENVIQVSGGKIVGVGRSKNVVRFLKTVPQIFNEQRERQGMGLIDHPRRVGVFAVIGVFVSPNSESGISKQDEDNMYTSLQECLQGSVVEDDRQVLFHAVTTFPVPVKKGVFSILFVWEILETMPTASVIETFVEFYNNFYKDRHISDFLKVVK